MFSKQCSSVISVHVSVDHYTVQWGEGTSLLPCKHRPDISSLHTVPTAAPVQCRGCYISELNLPHFHNTAVFFPTLLSFPVLERSNCGVFYFRTCLTSCFLAGAPTTTCPRKWLIGWGWSWGRWSRRNSATRRHGEYFYIFKCDLSPCDICVFEARDVRVCSCCFSLPCG